MRQFLLPIFILIPVLIFAQEKKTPFQIWRFKLDAPKDYHLPNPPLSAIVPGVVHLDLMNNGLAPDFYSGINEKSELSKKVEESNWIYLSSFELSADDLASKNMELVFEGLDTYAKVYLNDSLILTADNMFRTWEIPVKDKIKSGINELRIHFTSPLIYHKNTVQNASYELPSGNEASELKVSAYSRKAAYHFGWDWGPRFVTSGIWRPCYIRTWDKFRISDFFAETISVSESNATMFFHFTLESDSNYIDPIVIEMMGLEFQIFVKSGKNEVDFYHHIENPKLWYPNGCGDQPIYSSNIHLRNNQTFEIMHSQKVNFAIRTIELVNEKDSIGTSFYFKVNDKPIFIKGANYIPQDLFLPRVTQEKTASLIDLVANANMNMIRVWGGGIYASDYFYQQCDLHGILVWQDFMFANSMYPATKEFHKNVAAEIEDNVKRLRNHPCIALWCGNNEIEVAWQNWGWQNQYHYSAADSIEIWNNYKAIFHKLIPEKLKKLDHSRAYIPSSPQSNWGKPENFNHGAMHYWGVWHGKEPIENFKSNVGRFMVEYGFQSYPLYDFLEKTISRDELNIDSMAFQNRQKSYIGNALINAEIEAYFGKLELIDWLWASQYVQSEALKTAIIAHRLKAPHCMGTLFWQLNDCWPGASWSVLDYYQNQKIAYSEIKKWFAPTIGVIELNENECNITVHSDQNFSGTLIVSISNENNNYNLLTEQIDFELDALESKKIGTYSLKKIKRKIDLSDIAVEVTIYDMKLNEVFQNRVLFRKLRIDEIY